MCVCIFGVTFTYVTEGIDSKVISVCLINDYLLIPDLHIFVYARAECESISLEFTKVKLSILNNFGQMSKLTLYPKSFFSLYYSRRKYYCYHQNTK